MAWTNWVPASASPLTPVPLAFDRFINDNVPVHKEAITTTNGAITVNLPAAFASYIAADTSKYAVTMTLQTALGVPGQFTLTKAASSFTVAYSGEVGETVLIMVWYMG